MALAAAVPELEQRADLLMPAAMSLMALASYSILWFRDAGALSREAYGRMMAEMAVRAARAMAVAEESAPEEEPAPEDGRAREGGRAGESVLDRALARVRALRSEERQAPEDNPSLAQRLSRYERQRLREQMAAQARSQPHVLARIRGRLDAAFGERLAQVVLFGSRARGDAKPRADYDVAVFLFQLGERSEDNDKLAKIATNLLYESNAMLHFRVYRASTYNDRHVPEMTAIRREGVGI